MLGSVESPAGASVGGWVLAVVAAEAATVFVAKWCIKRLEALEGAGGGCIGCLLLPWFMFAPWLVGLGFAIPLGLAGNVAAACWTAVISTVGQLFVSGNRAPSWGSSDPVGMAGKKRIYDDKGTVRGYVDP